MLAHQLLVASRYRLLRRLGAGAMGAVYEALDLETERRRAIKLMHAHTLDRADLRERFRLEGRVTGKVQSPFLVDVLDAGVDEDGTPFLVMELLRGEDLRQRLDRVERFSPAETLGYVEQTALALDRVHAAGIVHRDLKPGNLFLEEREHEVPRVKVLDFGIAKLIESTAVSETTSSAGTPTYMAPEQFRGRGIAKAADVYALGMIAFTFLVGVPYWEDERELGGGIVQLALVAVEGPKEPAGERAARRGAALPPAFDAWFTRATAVDPGDRFPSAGAAALALAAALGVPSGFPVEALASAPEAEWEQATDGEATTELADRSGSTLAGSTVAPFGDADCSAPTTAHWSSFAEHEQGLFSLLMASPPVADPDAQRNAAQQSSVRSALAAMGLSADFMADGTLAVKVLGTGSATDQVAHAARAALVVKELWPAADVALATGRGDLEGPSIVGEVADRAVRLLMQSEPSSSGVWVDELSARLLGPGFALTPLADGDREGALLTGQAKDADLSRPLLGKPTPCVGREAELGSLEAQIAGCVEASEARAVLVTAPPGAGKSRLRHELLRRIERRGEPGTLLGGRGEATSAGAPYGILAAAIRDLAGVGGGDPLDEQRRLLRACVGRHLAHVARMNPAERERVVCFVGEMCDVPFPDEGVPMLQTARQEPKVMGDCLRRAVLDWLAAECAAGPVLVVLDDLQWGDALTVSVIDEALREQAGTPFFVLALARPEVHEAFPRLWHGHKTQEMVLRGLSRKACERLIQEVLGRDVPRAALDRAIEQSAGNALFLEELIRSIAEGKAEDQPETVVAMLQARIGRLPAGPRRALRAASVFGQTFQERGVAAVLGLHKALAEVTGWLSALLEAELIQPSPASRLHGHVEHGFRHALVRDAAYGLLTASDLATGHRLAGEFLAAGGEHDVAVVAEQFERGGDLPRAAAFYLRAAEESLPRGDYAGAQRLVARAEGCAPEGEVLGRLKSVVGYTGYYLNSYEGTAEAAVSALKLLRPGSLGWCRAMLGAIFAEGHDPAHTFELLSLLGCTEPEPDARIAYIETDSYVCAIIANSAPEPVMRGYLERLRSLVDSVSESVPAVRRYYLGVSGIVTLLRCPRPWSALADLGHALRLAEEVGDQKTEISLGANATDLGWLELGDVDGARRRMLALEERLSRSQEVMQFAIWAIYLARILCEAPDEQAWQKAEALVAQALSSASGHPYFQLAAPGALSRVAFVRGQIDKAEELARAAMDLLFLAPLSWVGTAAVHLRALIQLGRAPEACVVAEQVTGALNMLGGAGCYEVEARLAAAEAFEANGDPGRARAELGETLRQIALRAGDITDPFWRESYLTRNPSCTRALALGRAWRVNAGDPT